MAPYGVYTVLIIEATVIIGLVLFIASEILPFTPLAGNGLVDALVKALRVAFPKPEAEEK